MKPIVKIIGVILLILAVTVYTISNYLNGKVDLSFFLVAIVLLAYILIGMINQLVQYLKNN